MRFFLIDTNAGEVIAEIEAPSALAATFDPAAEEAPLGAVLVELRTGVRLAWRAELRNGGIGWVFVESANDALAFDIDDDEESRGAA